MSASMAEGIAALLTEHAYHNTEFMGGVGGSWQIECNCDLIVSALSHSEVEQAFAAHQADVLAANGYGKLGPTKFVLAEREAELLNLKGPCRAPKCVLHFAHRGPCDTRRPE